MSSRAVDTMSALSASNAIDEQQYQDDSLVDLYDHLNPLGRDSDYFIATIGPTNRSILDLGCGTGLLSADLAAHGHDVVGVDPSAQMLQVARSRTDLTNITWHCGDARQLDLGRLFDRVIASGHVFQVFLEASDQAAFLKTAKRHLKPGGLLIFDSRNPEMRPWQNWTPTQSRRRIEHAKHGPVEIWHQVSEARLGKVRFETTYYFLTQNKKLTSRSELAFPSISNIRDLLAAAKLDVVSMHGDWDASPFQSSSPEIIVVARRA
jgi:SAM-dependent methyltransferase